MADTFLPSGCTILFTNTITTNHVVDDFDQITVKLYGDSKSSTFSQVYALVEDAENKNFGVLKKTGEKELKFRALRAHTSKMLGRLKYEISFYKKINDIDFEDVGISIEPTGEIVDTSIVLIDNKSKSIII